MFKVTHCKNVKSDLLKYLSGQKVDFTKYKIDYGNLIIIPCHRVVRKNGELGGFSEGTRWKKVLLFLEK